MNMKFVHRIPVLADIDVVDENDVRPQIKLEPMSEADGKLEVLSTFHAEARLSVREEAPEGTLLALVSVTDTDSGQNAIVNCSVERGAEAEAAIAGVDVEPIDGRTLRNVRPAIAVLKPMVFKNRFSLHTGASFDRERVAAFGGDVDARIGDEVALRFRIGKTSGFASFPSFAHVHNIVYPSGVAYFNMCYVSVFTLRILSLALARSAIKQIIN